jgi:polysaccharide deacetylase 2 family uncharacterized protein YibQ
MNLKKTNSLRNIAAIAVIVLIAFICVQTVFFFRKRSEKPVIKPRKPAVIKPLPPKPAVKPGPAVAVKPGSAGRIAIVLDDWGYNRSHCKFLQSVDIPLGVAILPGLDFSKDVLACADAAGKDPMLHLPVEPHNPKEIYPGGQTLLVSMPQKEARAGLIKMLDDFKGIHGVNNHTGSKGTEDRALMTTVLSEIKRRGLFFVDSVTSERSVCQEAAAALKMKIGRRNVFLDNRNERAYIERQFATAARIAKKDGAALVIGHDRELTLKIVREQAEKLKAMGFEFLPIKEYIRLYEYPRN